jgi:hypothetical protein
MSDAKKRRYLDSVAAQESEAKHLPDLARQMRFKRPKRSTEHLQLRATFTGPEYQEQLDRLRDTAPLVTRFRALIPEPILERCQLQPEGETLIVYVDSASHRFELRQCLDRGAEPQLLAACSRFGVRKIKVLYRAENTTT